MPIRTHTAILALRDALAGDALLQQQASSGVHAHRFPVAPATASWCRVVVRALEGLDLEDRGDFVLQPLQVAVQAAGYDDADLLLAAALESVERVLVGLTLDTSYGRSLLPPERRTRPSVPVWDEKTRSFTSYATYLVALQL